jgi:hypothetical protein
MSGLIVIFVILFLLNIFFIINHDDDVVDAFRDRKPTPQEGIRRVRCVLTAFFASILGGSLLAVFVFRHIIYTFHLIDVGSVTNDTKDAIFLLCIALFMIFMKLFQNLLRTLQGRPARPIIDVRTLRRNIK